MTQIAGKLGTVTFEVVTDNEESKSLLHTIISNTVNSLVNQDTSRLRHMLDSRIQPRKRPAGASPADKYSRENIEEPKLIPLGGQWAYSVSIVVDERGEKAVRIAKGQIKGGYYRDKETGQMVLKPNDPMNPISLVNKINIKKLSEWNSLQSPVIDRLQAMEAPPK